PNYSPILAFAGQVNKNFLSVENHRHMSMRQPRCLRRSHRYLIPVGPFMYEWGHVLGAATDLTSMEKGEIVAALFEGFKRQDHAFGYARAFKGMMDALPAGLESLVMDLPYDLVMEIRKSRFWQMAELSNDEFEADFKQKLEAFECSLTGLRF